jgi:hypothetical protein
MDHRVAANASQTRGDGWKVSDGLLMGHIWLTHQENMKMLAKDKNKSVNTVCDELKQKNTREWKVWRNRYWTCGRYRKSLGGIPKEALSAVRKGEKPSIVTLRTKRSPMVGQSKKESFNEGASNVSMVPVFIPEKQNIELLIAITWKQPGQW